MKNKKINILIISVVSVLSVAMLSGCQTSQERIAELETTLGTYQELDATISRQTAVVNSAVAEIQASLSDPNLPADLRQQAVDALAIAESKLKSFSETKAKVADAITKLQAAIVSARESGDIDFAAEIGIWAKGAVLIGQFLPTPAQPYIALGATLATIIAEIFRRKGKKENTQLQTEKAQTEKKLDEVVTSQSIAADMSVEAAAAIRKANDKILTDPTVRTVTQILAS